MLEGLQFLVPAKDAAQPPGTQETCAVADELDEACPNGERTYLRALVADGAVYEDNQREEQEGKEEEKRPAYTENDAKHRAIGATWLRHSP